MSKNIDEDRYINKRKRKARKLSSLFLIGRIFPIKKEKIVFSAFEGDGGFCCNPRYIAEELYKSKSRFEMVWLTHDDSKTFPDYIKVVKDTPVNIAYHLSTAHVWIDNYRKPYGTLKRKKQLYIQTWHASIGFKAVGLFRGDAFPKIARIVSEWDSKLVDYVISNSEYCDRIYPQKLLYNGPTLRVGSPRVDCLINQREEKYKYLREKYGLSQDVKLLLFAPTFRGGNQKGEKQVIMDTPSIDFDHIIKVLQEKTHGEWRVLLRLHPQLAAKMEKMPLHTVNNKLIDVSQEPDISEILAASDSLVTDYSSCAFDACFAGIPVFLYADDIQVYVKDRGNLMWKMDELPFSIAETNEQLCRDIENFEYAKYMDKVKNFMEENGVIEAGTASKKVVEFINNYIYNSSVKGER